MSPCVYAPLDTRRPHGDSHSLLLQTNGAGAHSQLGRESIKNFDSCCLCLQPVIEPMSWCAFLAAHFASMQPHILLSGPTLGAVQPQGPHFLQRVHLPEFADAKTAHRSRPQVVREGAREQEGAQLFSEVSSLADESACNSCLVRRKMRSARRSFSSRPSLRYATVLRMPAARAVHSAGGRRHWMSSTHR